MTSLPRQTATIPPGSTVTLRWGDARSVGEAVVFGGNRGLIIASERLAPGTRISLTRPETGASTLYAVSWCGQADAGGRFKLALEAVSE